MEKTRKRRGTGRVTLQEVANFAGVGTMTVSPRAENTGTGF